VGTTGDFNVTTSVNRRSNRLTFPEKTVPPLRDPRNLALHRMLTSWGTAGDGGGGGGGGGLDSGRYDAVVVVGSELTRAAVSPTTSEGKRAVRDAGVMIREAVRMTRKDVWVLEPDGVAKDRRQPLTELNLQVLYESVRGSCGRESV
jgi:hypothetical protein